MRVTRAALRAKAEQPLIHEDVNAGPDIVLEDETERDTNALKEIVNLNTKTAAFVVSKENVAASNNDLTVQHDVQQTQLPPTASVQQPSPAKIVASSATEIDCEKKEIDPDCDKELPATPLVSGSPAESPPKSTTDCKVIEPESRVADYNFVAASTPKFDPTVYEPNKTTMEENDDSFVQSIKSRTPGKLSAPNEEDGEDSFVEKITSRTPGQTSRIEDSVAAMDALEDAIEQFSGELPVLDNLCIESPVKERHGITAKNKTPSSLQPQQPSAVAVGSRTASRSPAKSPSRTNPLADEVRVKPSASRHVAARSSTLGARRTVSEKSASLPSVPKRIDKATMSFSNSPLKAQPNLKKRTTSGVLSTSKAGFVPAKSTKAPTKSSFVLPGEIYAAKLKAEREAKQEDSTEVKQFKARPVPKSRPSVMPRENKASQARMSMVPSGHTARTAGTHGLSPPPEPTSKRVSSLDIAKVRNPSNSGLKPASSTVSKTSRASSKEPKFAANVPRVASLTTKPAPPPSEPEVAPVQKKVSGKQVFARSRLELKKQEDEKRQKEEAARKARAEAAERGRQASREWAEKKAKTAAAAVGAPKNAAK